MKITRTARALVVSALFGGIASQASVASAFVNCRAQWPATFTQCQTSSAPAGHASGSGLNSGGLFKVTANRIAGGFALAGALNAQGQAIPNCSVEDQTINNASASLTCPAGTPTPSFFFLRSQ